MALQGHVCRDGAVPGKLREQEGAPVSAVSSSLEHPVYTHNTRMCITFEKSHGGTINIQNSTWVRSKGQWKPF